jgi:hypothetical protein
MLIRIASLLALVSIFSVGATEAALIDSFDTGTQSLFVSGAQLQASQQLNVGTGTAIGGYRDISLKWTSGFLDFASVSISGPQGLFVFTQLNSAPASTGEASITWDGSDTPNLLSYLLKANLTENSDDKFIIDVNTVAGSGMDILMTVYSDSARASRKTISLPGGYSGALPMLYSDFLPIGTGGAADFSSVGAIVLTCDGSAHEGASIVLNSVETAHEVVPEPSTLVMLAFGAMALVGMGRRWRRD